MGVVGADGGRGRRGAADANDPGRGSSRGRRGVRSAAERHRERADKPQRSESGVGPGRRPVPDHVHGRRAAVQLGVGQRRVRTPAHRRRVQRV